MTTKLALDWVDTKNGSKARLSGDTWLVISLEFDELVLEVGWRWAIQVLHDEEGDCGEIKSRDAAKVHAERCAREYFDGLAGKLLAP